MTTSSLTYHLYSAAGFVLKPLLPFYWQRRARKGKEIPARQGERFGRPALKRPAGKLIWFHAASLGEAQAAQNLMPALDEFATHQNADLPQYLITTQTITAAEAIAKRNHPRLIHQFMPFDIGGYYQKFLDHWHPDLLIGLEGEFWPQLISATHRRQIPILWVNGKFSDKSFQKWQRLDSLARHMMTRLDLVLTQTKKGAGQFTKLGAANVKAMGNLKFAGTPLPDMPAARQELANVLHGRPLWLAASTHPGEEEIIARIHKKLAPDFPNLLTILIPRHPYRRDEIKMILDGMAIPFQCRSDLTPLAPETQIYLADTMGEMGLFYRLAEIIFIGGSLVPIGGHNLLEAAQLDSVILHGPYMNAQDEIMKVMQKHNAAILVADENALYEKVKYFLENPASCDEWQARAQKASQDGHHILTDTIKEMTPFLLPIFSSLSTKKDADATRS